MMKSSNIPAMISRLFGLRRPSAMHEDPSAAGTAAEAEPLEAPVEGKLAQTCLSSLPAESRCETV